MPTTDPQLEQPTLGRRPGIMAWVLLIPLLAWLLLFVVIPTLIMVVISFGQRTPLGEVTFTVTTETGQTQLVDLTQNYARIFTQQQVKPVLVALLGGSVIGLVMWQLTRSDRFRYSTWGGMRKPVVFVTGLVGFYGLLNWLVLSGPGSERVMDWLEPVWYLTVQAWNSVWGVFWSHLWFETAEAPVVPGGVNALKILVISINYAALGTIICVLAGYPVAYFIAKTSDRWRNFLLMLVMIPFWTNFLVRTYAWVTILRSEGVLNSLLIHLGWITEPLDMYPSSGAVLIGLVYTYLPFMILPIYASVERLDNAVIEAALDLGASPLRAFQNVIMPLTRPGIVAGILLVFVPSIGMFAINDILSGGQVELIGNIIESQFKSALNPPYGATLGTLLLGMFVIVYFVATRRRPRTEV
ncbi:MAG: hypothetical protein KatS3mg104_2217 [Phycisphaerae bacterium]|nr:MAG: hypothetical protein KatS3mg104_2217 [Phycisphaerae bacterium]